MRLAAQRGMTARKDETQTVIAERVLFRIFDGTFRVGLSGRDLASLNLGSEYCNKYCI